MSTAALTASTAVLLTAARRSQASPAQADGDADTSADDSAHEAERAGQRPQFTARERQAFARYVDARRASVRHDEEWRTWMD